MKKFIFMLMTVFLFSVSAKSFASEQDVGCKQKTEKISLDHQKQTSAIIADFSFCQRTDIMFYAQPFVFNLVVANVGKLSCTHNITLKIFTGNCQSHNYTYKQFRGINHNFT